LGFLRNKWATISLLILVWALIASLMAGYYYIQYNDVSKRIAGVLIYVNIGVDFGNGTRVFSNDTKTVTGATLFDVTKLTFNVNYNVSLYGTEVTSIDGVAKTGSYGWTYWIWNSTVSSWSIVWENADSYKVTNQETFMWYYQNDFNPPS
jgi:hypothetical protein